MTPGLKKRIKNRVRCCWALVLVVALGTMSRIPSWPDSCSPSFPVPSSPGDPGCSFPVPSCPVPCALSLCQRLSRGAAPAQGVQGWAGKEEGYSKNPSKNQLGLREKEKGFWLLSPVPKVSPWLSWARCSRGRAGNFGVHREKNKDNFQAEMQQSEEARGNAGLHQIPPGLYMEHFQINF